MQDLLVYLAFRSLFLAVYVMPFRLNAVVGRLLGRAYYCVDRRRRRFINANLCVVFGGDLDQKEREIMGRETCQLLATNILDFLKMDRIANRHNFHRFIEFEGLPNLMESIQKGKGTVGVMGHFGNLFLVRYVCYLDIPPRAAIIRELDNPYLERFMRSVFKHHDAVMIRPDGAIKKMQRLLQRNFIGLTLADQKAGGNPRTGRHGVVVDFFGIPSQTHTTAYVLARRTGASVIPLFVLRQGPGRYTIHIHEPLNLIHTADETRDLKENTRRLNEIFEDYIRRHPLHWFWLHRRWKDIPGLESLYETNDPLELIGHFRRDPVEGT